jgi:hypothetical protein
VTATARDAALLRRAGFTIRTGSRIRCRSW